MWSVSLIDNESASLLFSQISFPYCFCVLSEFAKVFERKVICIMQRVRVHFQVRVGGFNCQQIFTKISFVSFDIVVSNKSNVV